MPKKRCFTKGHHKWSNCILCDLVGPSERADPLPIVGWSDCISRLSVKLSVRNEIDRKIKRSPTTGENFPPCEAILDWHRKLLDARSIKRPGRFKASGLEKADSFFIIILDKKSNHRVNLINLIYKPDSKTNSRFCLNLLFKFFPVWKRLSTIEIYKSRLFTNVKTFSCYSGCFQFCIVRMC